MTITFKSSWEVWFAEVLLSLTYTIVIVQNSDRQIQLVYFNFYNMWLSFSCCYNWPMSYYYFLLSQPLKHSRYLQGTWEFQPKQSHAAIILDAVISVFSNIFSGMHPGRQGSQQSPVFSDNLKMYEIPVRTTENKEHGREAKFNILQVKQNVSRMKDAWGKLTDISVYTFI